MQDVRMHRGRLALAAAGFRFGFRFASGRPLDGRRKTDATFLRSGTTKFAQADRITKWSYLPEWQRAATRLGTMTVVVLVGIAYLLAPVATLAVLGASVVTSLMFIGYRIHRSVPEWKLRRKVVRPMWKALESHGVKRVDWIQVPVGYELEKDAAVEIRLPDHWSGDHQLQKAFQGIVERKLGGDWDSAWTHRGKPSVRFTRAPHPPTRVLFADCLPIIRNLKPGQLLLGLGSRNDPVIISMDEETPHVALSVGTGGGKSATLCLLVVQLLAQGATVEGIDPKRVSLNPLRGLPGIRIHRTSEQQWDAIAMVRAEMDRRYAVLDEDENATFPRIVLVIEEANSFYIDNVDHWDEIKPKGAPKTPRVYRDLNQILNKGRQANVNVITVFQEMNAQVSGGGSARAQYGFKVLGRFTPQAWKMLVDTYPRPGNTTVPGQVVVATGAGHRTVQTAYALRDKTALTSEAWDHAMSGAGHFASEPQLHVPVSQASQDGPGLANVAGTVPEQAVGLRQAVESDVVPMTLDALRKASQRDPEFPRPALGTSGTEKLYYPAELRRWVVNRPRAGQMSGSRSES